jgi:predicted aspartyl protease
MELHLCRVQEREVRAYADMVKSYKYRINNNEAWVDLGICAKDSEIDGEERFLVDTGASTSSIKIETLSFLGYNIDWIIKNNVKIIDIILADGNKVQSYKIKLSKIKLIGELFIEQEFNVFIEGGEDEDNILGMDILSHFDFTFSFSTQLFMIESCNV